MNINPILSEDGGKIRELCEGALKEDEISISSTAFNILDKIPVEERINYLYHSTEKELEDEKKQLINKLKESGGIAEEGSSQVFIPRNVLEKHGIVSITKNNLDTLVKEN